MSCIDFKGNVTIFYSHSGNMALLWGHNGNNMSFSQQNVPPVIFWQNMPHEILNISHVFRNISHMFKNEAVSWKIDSIVLFKQYHKECLLYCRYFFFFHIKIYYFIVVIFPLKIYYFIVVIFLLTCKDLLLYCSDFSSVDLASKHFWCSKISSFCSINNSLITR